jgi:HEAT repeat protein
MTSNNMKSNPHNLFNHSNGSDPAESYLGDRQPVKRIRNMEEIIKVSAPILDDLTHLGFEVNSISDLYTKKINYKDAIPLLLYWLPNVNNIFVKEAIVRAISVSWAKPVAAPILINEFIKAGTGYSSLKWAIGNALSIVANDSVYKEIINLVQDTRNGKAREMLVIALGEMKEPQVEDVLINLLSDEQMVGYAIIALGKLKSKKAFPEIEKFQLHSEPWIRREAKKALTKIENG